MKFQSQEGGNQVQANQIGTAAAVSLASHDFTHGQVLLFFPSHSGNTVTSWIFYLFIFDYIFCLIIFVVLGTRGGSTWETWCIFR